MTTINFRALFAFLLVFGSLNLPPAHGKTTKLSDLTISPTISSVVLKNGELIASGSASVLVNGQTIISSFTTSVTIRLAQYINLGCPLVEVVLGSFTLDFDGLVVETDPICFAVTAFPIPVAGTFADQLCNFGTLLGNGLTYEQVLAGGSYLITPAIDFTILNPGLAAILNTPFSVLFGLDDATLASIEPGSPGPVGACPVLEFNLVPLNLSLLGLQVNINNCDNGAISFYVTGEHGSLLGNHFCSVAQRADLAVGATTLQDLLNAILSLLPH